MRQFAGLVAHRLLGVGLEAQVAAVEFQLLDGARVAQEGSGAGQFAGVALELEALDVGLAAPAVVDVGLPGVGSAGSQGL